MLSVVLALSVSAVVSAQSMSSTTTMMPMSDSGNNMMSSTMPSMTNMAPGMAMPTMSPSSMMSNDSNSGSNMSSDDADTDADWNAFTANITSMDASNATAAVYDDMSDIVQLAMNATTFLFSNREIQSFMAAQDGMDWLWKPVVSARWCAEACIAVNKTMCPSGQLDMPMMRTDSCRTCVLECLACTMEDNYWMTLRSYVMTLMAPVIQLVSSTMAVDVNDQTQATQAQNAQQQMYNKFNAAVVPLVNRMMLDKMYGLNCQMFASYQGPTNATTV